MNVVVSFGINGNLSSAIMMSHRMTLLALTLVDEEMWPDALAALVVVHPIRLGEGDDDYIAIVLDATLCHMELCASAQERGLQFLEGFVDDCEDIIVVFKTVNAAMEQVNKELSEVVAKPSKRSRMKKKDTPMGAQEIGDKIAIIGESSRPKRKSISASGEREASKGKKREGKLTLAVAIVQANNLTSKTKLFDVEAMYKSLEDGLGQCFPYGQDPLPCKIPAEKIHLALDSLKYHVFFEKRKEQVQLEREALGMICRKPKLYCVLLKKAPMLGGGLEDEGPGLIL